MKNILLFILLIALAPTITAQDAGLSIAWNGSAYVVKMEVVTGANPLLLGSSQVSIVTPAAVSTAGMVVTCVAPCSPFQWGANVFVNAPAAAPGNNFVAIATQGGNMGNVPNGASITLFTFTLPGGCNNEVRLFTNGTDPNSGQMPGGEDFSNTLVNGLTAAEFYNGINIDDVNCAPLPLALLRFDAVFDGESVRLGWHTQNEQEVAAFDIQRAINGLNFESIGVKSAENTPSAQYNWLDDRLPVNTDRLYYRLEQRDRNGNRLLSPVRQVRIPREALLVSAAPNPADELLTVSVFVPVEATVSIEISDAGLRNLYSARHTLGEGRQAIPIPVADWPSGTYILKVVSAETRVTERVVVQH